MAAASNLAGSQHRGSSVVQGYIPDPIILIGWLATTVALTAMILFKDRFFPTCVLRVGMESNLVRCYVAKLILAVALLS